MESTTTAACRTSGSINSGALRYSVQASGERIFRVPDACNESAVFGQQCPARFLGSAARILRITSGIGVAREDCISFLSPIRLDVGQCPACWTSTGGTRYGWGTRGRGLSGPAAALAFVARGCPIELQPRTARL